MPSQQGKLAIVTGATGGLGYETALALAQQGAEVILAARNADKGRDALASIHAAVPHAKLHFARVDLASLASVAEFSANMLEQGRPIDLLVNNAGVMALPERQETVDGFEMQLGVNYFSHYALTGRLLPLLRKAPAPRVVNLSSLMHRSGKIHLDDLQLQRGYTPTRAYAQSKLAMLMFALELQRRSDAQGWRLLSNAAHPGYARTDLIPNGPGTDSFLSRFSMFLQPFMSQSAADGAWPTLQAATAPDAKPAGYYGPNGWLEMRGASTDAKVSARARDTAVGKRLWDMSAQLTGVSFS
jgi:NAD(P)-dependent dehydrogenase (short-subunit alcohol dehydrogenase family)